MRFLSSTLFAVSLCTVAACTDPVLEQRVADLEKKVGDLETTVGELKTRPAPPMKGKPTAEAAPSANPEDEEKAAEMLRQANSDVQEMKYDDAKVKLAELCKSYPTSRACRSSSRLVSELEVIGKDAGDLEVEKWYQGSASFRDGKATLVVFFETWCPHCQREVPVLEEAAAKYKPMGLNVIGLTKVTKSSTDEKVSAFLEEKKVTYPVGKEAGAMSERFGVRGIPAAAVVKDGKVVWRGHPARITEEMYKAWLGAP